MLDRVQALVTHGMQAVHRISARHVSDFNRNILTVNDCENSGQISSIIICQYNCVLLAHIEYRITIGVTINFGLDSRWSLML